jgi:hypothetical protein
MPTSPLRLLGLGILFALGAAGCAGEDARFSVKHAPDFVVGPHKVSVFGVFRDGQLSAESWNEVGPTLSGFLGKETCDLGFGEKLQSANSQLYASTEESAKSDGITDDLLKQFAPMAGGDEILVVYVHGKTHAPPKSAQNKPQQVALLQMGGMGRGGGMGGMGRGGQGRQSSAGSAPPKPADDLEISASLYSVREGRVLARASMVYSGPSFENAMKLFVGKLATVIPGSSCMGWTLAKP